MEENINIVSYSIPLDCIDWSLPRFQDILPRRDKPLPIWSVDTHADQYYEFTVYGEPSSDKEIEDSISRENNDKTTCHICNIDVPTAYIEQHSGSDHHQTCTSIIGTAMCRVQKHTANTILVPKAETGHYFCKTCSIVINKKETIQHLATKMHQLNIKYEETIKNFAKAFIDKGNFIQKLEEELKQNIFKGQMEVENDERKSVINHDTRLNENIHRVDRIGPYSESRKSSISSDSDSSQTSENKTKLRELKDYFKNMKFSYMTLTVENYYGKYPGVTLKFTDGIKIKTSMDRFHGFYGEERSLQCRVCRVMVEDQMQHIHTSQHMQRIQAPLTGYCFRQLDSIWYHCILCNAFLENIDVHTKTPDHISQVNQCWTQNIPAFTATAATSKGHSKLCKYCNIALPHGKPGKSFRKSHNKTVQHKYQKWLATKDKKIHYLMSKHNNDLYAVICMVCGYLVTNQKEDIDEHLKCMDHEIQYKRLLDNNSVTITSEMLANCSICGTNVLFFEIISHINKKTHKKRVAAKTNVIPTQVFEANQNISQTLAETKVTDFGDKTTVLYPTKTINNNSDSKNLLGADNKIADFESPMKDGKHSSVNTSEVGEIVQSNTISSVVEQVTAKHGLPATTVRYENWLKLNNYTRVEADSYHCEFCQIFVTKSALFDHSLSSTHQTALSITWTVSNGSTNCETCETKVPNNKDCITEHVNGRNHATKLTQQLPNTIKECKDCGTELNPQVSNKDEPAKYKLNVSDNSENIEATHINKWNYGTSHLFKASEDKDVKTAQNKNENASLAIQNTSKYFKDEQNETTANMNSANVANGRFFKQNMDSELCCLLCSTKVPNTQINITEHLNGKQHKENFKLLDDDDSIILRNKSYFCTACSTYNTLSGSLKHIKTLKHQNAIKISQSSENETRPASLAIPSTSTHVEDEANETTKTATNQNITDLNDVKIFVKQIGTEVHCRLCATKVPNITDHLKGKRHNENLKLVSDNNLILLSKSAYYCQVCSALIPIPDTLQHIQNKKHQSAITTALDTKPETPITQQKASKEKQDIETVDKGAYCKICLVYTGKGISRKTHNNSIQHKTNDNNKLKKMLSSYPFVTKPSSDKSHCTICDEEVQILKIEKHVSLKSHTDRLLEENLRDYTSRSFIEYLQNHEVYDHGDSNFHCRLCKISFHGRWRADIHILGKNHLILLEKHNQTIGLSLNKPFLGTKNENASPNQLNQATTSGVLVKDTMDSFKYEKKVAFRSGQESVNTSEVHEGVSDIDSSGKPDNQHQNKAAAKDTRNVEKQTSAVATMVEQNIPEFFEKTDRPREIYCIFCKVIVPFHESNIESHVRGAKHIARRCQQSDGNPLETLTANNKTVKTEKVLTGENCSEKFDVKTLTEQIKTKTHINNSLSQPGTSKIPETSPEIIFNEDYISNSFLVQMSPLVSNNDWIPKQSDNDNSKTCQENFDVTQDDGLTTTTDVFLQYCKCCKLFIVQDSVTAHVATQTHSDYKYLISHEVEKLSNNSFRCRICPDRPRQVNHSEALHHVETDIHQSNHMIFNLDEEQNEAAYKLNMKLTKFSSSQEQLKIATCRALDTSLKHITGNTYWCRVCRLNYKSVDEYHAHLDKNTHRIMFEVMLSANGMKFPVRGLKSCAFCQVCKKGQFQSILLDHIETAHHKIKLLDSLKNMGKQMFTLLGHYYSQFTITNVLKMPDEVLNHLLVLSKVCNVCNMKMLKKNKAINEASWSHRDLVSKLEELEYNRITINEKDVCFCEPCDMYFSKDTAMTHVKSSNHINNFSAYLKNMFV